MNKTVSYFEAAKDAVSYEIRSSLSSDGYYSRENFSTVTALSYTGFNSGRFYKVRAKYSDGTYSNYSNIVN